MFPADTFNIHTATTADTDTLNELAARNNQQPLTGHILIGHTNTGKTAALSLDNGTAIADPGAEPVAANLRVRAIGTWTQTSAPQLRDRMLSGLPAWYRAVSIPVTAQTTEPEREPALA
jgi:hypothetical protein